ncbi:MAG: ShlB/FhaC/HecB family hemolysin secretion/activation protein, partial [Azoarcus sp.]|nr:ShlB/FhaC/HecB family hemolysin secretion/activation protein [Azoarcus sp.]
ARNGFLHYSLPWGWWTAAYNLTYTDYESGFRNGQFWLNTSGWSRAHDLRLSRVLHRDATSKTTLNLALNQTETRGEIENIALALSSVRLTEAGLGIAHGRRIGPAYLNLELGWQRGLTLLGAERDRNLPEGAAHAQYDKATLTAAFLYPFQLLSQSP